MRIAFSSMTFAIAAFCLGTPAFAWWDAGHMQIAALAYDRLDPAVRTSVDSLIELNPSYPAWTAGVAEADKAKAAFVHAATWADDIKRDPAYTRDTVDAPTASQNLGYADRLVHDYWHYIDLPFSTDETEVAPPVSPNALTQVQLFTATLGSDASDDLKSYDLVWLLHLVGDLHQPLHATARFSQPLGDDRGGNDETVQPTQGQPLRLHLYWDSLLGEGSTPSAAIVAARGLPATEPAAASVSDPALWIIESFAIAQNEVYTDLIGPGAGPFPLTQAYEDHALVVARERASLAGARLATLINAALK
jgi:hypothetical protein